MTSLFDRRETLSATSPIAEMGAAPRLSRAKRVMDLVLALGALVVLAPLLAAIAIAIRIDSPGPVLYRQMRNGCAGSTFSIFKFRTMTADASRQPFRQATRGDARITRLGRWLRRSNIDELPQFINVVLGHMTLVGPRPHPIALDEHFAPLIPRYMDRYAVRPGLTGLAQVRGQRGETRTREEMENRVASDIAYIECWSLMGDVVIMARTLYDPRGRRNAF